MLNSQQVADESFRTNQSVQVREVDNRGSNFYLALYWAEELAKKDATWQVIEY